LVNARQSNLQKMLASEEEEMNNRKAQREARIAKWRWDFWCEDGWSGIMKSIICFFVGHQFLLNWASYTRPQRAAWVFACHRCGKTNGPIESSGKKRNTKL